MCEYVDGDRPRRLSDRFELRISESRLGLGLEATPRPLGHPRRRLVANGPGLFWLYILVDALRSAESTAYWFGTTPTGELSIFAQYNVAILLAVLWFGMVLALFKRPLKEAVGEVRS